MVVVLHVISVMLPAAGCPKPVKICLTAAHSVLNSFRRQTSAGLLFCAGSLVALVATFA